MRRGLARLAAGAALACLLAACAGERERIAAETGLRVTLEDVPAPEVVEREGTFAVAPETDGLWVALPGLARAERGRVTAPVNGRSLVAALFPAGASGPAVSAELAGRLGLEGANVRLAVVALRQEARILP